MGMGPEASKQTGQACIVEYFFIYKAATSAAPLLFSTSSLLDYSN
jgi:hypothetical protein